MATHGGSDLPEPDLSQTGQATVAPTVPTLPHSGEVPAWTPIGTGEDATAIGHVEAQDTDPA